MSKQKLVTDRHGVRRCWWCGTDPLYVDYHDHEWGFPVTHEHRLFEKICLEGFQAGLSWLNVLRKRENFRRAFKHFDFSAVARFNRRSVERLLQNDGIIRHRGKIESTINNARRAVELASEFGSLARFLWQYAPATEEVFDGCKSTSPESTALSKELKRRGWTFVGPTTAYAFMQATGMVNDHLPGCVSFAKVDQARSEFRRPIRR